MAAILKLRATEAYANTGDTIQAREAIGTASPDSATTPAAPAIPPGPTEGPRNADAQADTAS